MKKIFITFFTVALVFAGCSFRETIRVPGASWLGIGPGVDVEIANYQLLYTKVVVLGEEVVRLSPGSTAYDRWHIAFSYEELPVAFLQYRDSSYSYEDFIGVSGTILWGREGSSGGIYLEVGQERSWKHSRGGYFPTPIPRGKRWSIDLPTIRLESAIALQFVNCEPYKAIVTYADGEQKELAKQGDYFSDEVFARDNYRHYFGGPRKGLIRVEWEDERGRIVGVRNYSYDLNTGRGGLRGRGPRAYQYFLKLS